MDTTQPVGNVSTAYSAAGKQPTEEAARALLAFISAGDRSAMDRLYVSYFASLANFFLHLTAHADLVEELINDTMLEVWREGASIGANASVAVSIMGLAYSHGQKRVAKVGARRLHSQPSSLHTEHDSPRSTTLKASSCPDDSLLRLPVEERALLHCLCGRVLAAGRRRHNEYFVRVRRRAVEWCSASAWLCTGICCR
jgi:hypothetical protein